MFRNYFYLYRCTGDMNRMLKGKSITEAYTQEKDKLFLRVPLDGNNDHHLIFNCSPVINYVLSRDRHFKAKKNTINFFNDLLPDKIEKVKIARYDRTIIFDLQSSRLYFLIQGKDTNVVIQNSDSITAFKKYEMEKFNGSIVSIDNEKQLFDFIETLDSGCLEWKTFSKKYPFAGKEIFLQAKARQKSDSLEEFKEHIKKCIEELLKEQIAVYYDSNALRPYFIPATFLKEDSSTDDLRMFTSYFEAVNYYLTLKFKNEGEESLKTKIEKYADSEIEKLSAKLNNLKFRIDSGSREEEYKNYGTLLLSNIYNIVKGTDKIEIEDYNTDKKVVIELNAKLSPQKNVDRYFEKSRDEKIGFEQSKELYKNALNKIKIFQDIKTAVNSDLTMEELNQILKKLKINPQGKSNKMEDKCNFKHYLLHCKYHIYVGKDSKNNDELTTQFAKQNDLWFHARSVSGSHVVLRVENLKEAVPKNIIKETASVAAFHSKAKTSGVVPVTYTFRKYVHKKKGLNQGAVILSRENVVLVRPEIPKECELVVSDLI